MRGGFFTFSQCHNVKNKDGHPMKGHKNVKNCPKNNPEAQDGQATKKTKLLASRKTIIGF